MAETIVCKKCQVEQPRTEYYEYVANGVRGLRKKCRSCWSQQQKVSYQRRRDREIREKYSRARLLVAARRQYVVEYLSMSPCAGCGEADIRVLEFHHRDPTEKHLEVSRMAQHAGALEAIVAEIAKCDVLCANCHRRTHSESYDSYRSRWLRGESLIPPGRYEGPQREYRAQRTSRLSDRTCTARTSRSSRSDPPAPDTRPTRELAAILAGPPEPTAAGPAASPAGPDPI